MQQQKSSGVAAPHPHCPAPQDRAQCSLPIPWVEKPGAGQCSWGRKAHQHKGSEIFEVQVLCCLFDHSLERSQQVSKQDLSPLIAQLQLQTSGNPTMGKGNQSKEVNNLPGLSQEPVMGMGGGQPACPTAQPASLLPIQTHKFSWHPGFLLSLLQARHCSRNADSKIKPDELVPIYLILLESQSPGGRVCCLCTLPGLQQPAGASRATKSTSTLSMTWKSPEG